MRSRLVGVAALLFTGLASGHETWLLPARFVATSADTFEVALTSGMQFPEPDYAIRRERVSTARMRVGARVQPIDRFRRDAHALALQVHPGRDGWATFWIAMPGADIVLDDAHVATYLDEIGADQATRDVWKGMHARWPWRERYAKSAKTLVAVGSTVGDDSWRTPVGLPLEFVPEQSPDAMPADGAMRFRLLWRGQPLAGASVGLMATLSSRSAYTGRRVLFTTAADGTVTVPTDSGRPMLLYAVRLQADTVRGTWTSDFTTLTIMPTRATSR